MNDYPVYKLLSIGKELEIFDENSVLYSLEKDIKPFISNLDKEEAIRMVLKSNITDIDNGFFHLKGDIIEQYSVKEVKDLLQSYMEELKNNILK